MKKKKMKRIRKRLGIFCTIMALLMMLLGFFGVQNPAMEYFIYIGSVLYLVGLGLLWNILPQ